MNSKITIIERQAEDNGWNLAERDLINHYCERHGEEINSFEVGKLYVKGFAVSGRVFVAKVADTSGFALTKYLYLNEIINGKEKRIKKSDY